MFIAIFIFLFATFSISGNAQTTNTAAAAGPVLVAKIAANISTKNAKVGDAVIAKTVKPGKLTDGTDLPKGSKLTGKVESVQSKKSGDGGNSLLTFRFDSAEVKGGAVVPIQGMVVAIGPEIVVSGAGPAVGVVPTAPTEEGDIPMGSTLEGVALGRHSGSEWSTVMQGIHKDIGLDTNVVVKVQLM